MSEGPGATRRADPAGPLVAILLCTYNGAAHLAEQLASIEAQTYGHWRVWASDDASSDGTRELLDAWAKRWGDDRLTRLDGPARGHFANFLSLVRQPAVHADLYAFCDQDDLWEPDKLARAVAWLAPRAAERPALYCGRTRYVDEANREIGRSPLFARPPSFENALTQSLAGGNTMVLNNALRALLARTDPQAPGVAHDWLTYLVATGCGGVVHFDPQPTLRYRQHGGNAIGAGQGWGQRLGRLRAVWRGRNRGWHDANFEALRPLEPALTPRNRALLAGFHEARTLPPWQRVKQFHACGLYRQTRWGTLGLYFAMLTNRL